MEYILASASPRRKELLAMLPISFEICPAKGEEHLPEGLPAEQAAEYLAVQKAEEVAAAHPDAVVIGADTVVFCNNEILGKPRDKADCIRMLTMLSGNEHTVSTGVAIVHGGKTVHFSDDTQVLFYTLTAAEIEAYADTEEPYDKAGGYGIQGKAALMIEGIRGDYYNVMGLPIAKLARSMKEMGLLP